MDKGPRDTKNMDKEPGGMGPSKIVWAGIPGSICNLDCAYCYVGSHKGKKGEFAYPVDHMIRCFEPARFGGPIFFGAASSGETLLWEGIIDFTHGMLSHGHVVSYTTNMTLTPVIRKFCDFPPDLRSRLELDASLHYLELKQKKALDIYFDNLRMLKSAGISIALFLCISDAYLPYLREISERCREEIGLLPVAGMTRRYDKQGAITSGSYSPEKDALVKETCDFRQWELQKRIYGQKRTEICHAGEYSINVDLGSGSYSKCWGNSGWPGWWWKWLSPFQVYDQAMRKLRNGQGWATGNIFADPESPIRFEPIGTCPFRDCVCASYLCWGLIPELAVDTHSRSFFTRDSVSQEVWNFMDSRVKGCGVPVPKGELISA
ncbi:MAG: radical SAM protein [bacterium]